MTKFQVARVALAGLTRIEVMAAEWVELRPSPECESTILASSDPNNIAQGYPLPADGFRWSVKGDGHNISFYVATEDGQYHPDTVLHVIAR